MTFHLRIDDIKCTSSPLATVPWVSGSVGAVGQSVCGSVGQVVSWSVGQLVRGSLGLSPLRCLLVITVPLRLVLIACRDSP